MVKAPCGIIGDVDGDGDITQQDLELAFSLYGSKNLTPDQIKRLDVNGNGRFDANDMVLIGQYARGEIKTFPACPVKDNSLIYLGLGLLAAYIISEEL